jgi:hypothetical protein
LVFTGLFGGGLVRRCVSEQFRLVIIDKMKAGNKNFNFIVEHGFQLFRLPGHLYPINNNKRN